MNIETLKLPAVDLKRGMHVVKLDRPWLETPFKLQGFTIVSTEELRLLRKLCQFVYIDIRKGGSPLDGKGERVVLTESGEPVAPDALIGGIGTTSPARRSAAQVAADVALPPPAAEYPIETEFAAELPAAREAVTRTKDALKQFLRMLRLELPCELEPLREAAAALEASGLRNPDPIMLLRALACDESFSYRHSVNSAIVAIGVAREMGLRRQGIHELAMGMLLADIGKQRLPQDLLRSPRRLDAQDAAVMQQHVSVGVEMAQGLGGLTPGTLQIIAMHHERFNGSGYPAGLRGGQIPVLARIAGLADTFDAVTSERGYALAIPVHEAVQELYAATVDIFQRELVEKLIQALGTYPVGSLVALSDGCIALVIALNRHRRLLPTVICLTDAARRPLRDRICLDLAAGDRPGLTVKEVLHEDTCGVPIPDIAALLG